MRERINFKKPEWSAILAAFFVGLAVHMFGLTNLLHNGDDITAQPVGFGVGVESGRFFLHILKRLCQRMSGGYNVSWLNGILFIVLIAIAAGIVISIFDIKSKKIAAAVGIIFVTFPSVTATMGYRFTAGCYGVAIVLAVLAAWLLIKWKWGLILSVVCIALSLGIYQAYTPITISILVLYLLKQTIQGETRFLQTLIKGVYFCVTLLLGFLLYTWLLDLCLKHYEATLLSYQGINQMGSMSLAEIPDMIWHALQTFFCLPTEDYAMLAQTELLKTAYLCVYIITLITIVCVAIVRKLRIEQIIMAVLLTLVLPLAINFVMIMCPHSSIHCLMVYSFVIVPCLPLILLEACPELDGIRERTRQVIKVAAIGVVAVIVASNAYFANVNYTAAYYANRQTENYITSLVTQIRATDGFTTEKRWAIVGNIQDPLLTNSWQNVPVYMPSTTDSSYLLRGWEHWLRVRYGYQPAFAGYEELARLQESEEVQQMPCWPNEGSIKVIGDCIVIKFSN